MSDDTKILIGLGLLWWWWRGKGSSSASISYPVSPDGQATDASGAYYVTLPSVPVPTVQAPAMVAVSAPRPSPDDIAKMAGGVLPNPAGFTIGDALTAALLAEGKPVSMNAMSRLNEKLRSQSFMVF